MMCETNTGQNCSLSPRNRWDA